MTKFCWVCSRKLCGNGRYFAIVVEAGIEHRCCKICAQSLSPELTAQVNDKAPRDAE